MARTVKGTLNIEGQEIQITNPDKPLWPEVGITKAMYLQKLAAISPFLLRYCQGRLLTTIRYPHGVQGESFYQKNAPEPLPPFVHTYVHENINYVLLNGLPELLWLGNLAALEFHPSLHLAGSDQPCEWMIDLDPTLPEEPRIMEATAIVGNVLNSLGLNSVPKTSGATGVQIIVPIPAGVTFDELRAVGQFVGQYVTEKFPKLFTIERLKKNRGDKIYFDYLQHYSGRTLAAPYTPRARKLATVSTPLTWEEVHRDVSPTEFHLLNIVERLQEKGDLLQALPPQPIENVIRHLTSQGKNASKRKG
ncbi:DNA polymerase domain-containing protein [Paenibacillus glucanolyticus]|jgi:bifunctional non-homologous end joining protein LigD|uniref:non-homologous end-joining DNA ligase n=1 Tax=Paenibacillus TaxID=44249 RepID=UPI0003E1F9FB|nr:MULTISPECIES: non-homologous end-joining DNA ligase [Paenibacillus]ANA79262.1 DNA polymerase domain-containing protein [Paenibacillus glucanolyticus]AVV56796.1 DNA polymerase domain-containing protein [Paenibacillus glucanolyticus]AWP25961.1 DNA polymerase domain-containing protein [Paenibacillus sp. Cedars]ETT37901.1 DNA polymerase LigD, polymerase domain-containing protein [Paenibacillus sp. FSL R5-808]MDH6673565.1 bifunctional non-homologous end joining protein LigD [Paenibacillus sp. LB